MPVSTMAIARVPTPSISPLVGGGGGGGGGGKPGMIGGPGGDGLFSDDSTSGGGGSSRRKRPQQHLYANPSQPEADDDDDDDDESEPRHGGGGGGAHKGPVPAPHRRPRGRPLGSKNKPKPPTIISRDCASALRAHVLEVPAECDVAACVAGFARARRRGLCILSGSGAVSDVALRQPAAAAVARLQGRFEILSITGAFLPPGSSASAAAASPLTVFLAGPQGSVVGGRVIGSLVAAAPVVIIASSFLDASFDHLPFDDDDADDAAANELDDADPDPSAAAAAANNNISNHNIANNINIANHNIANNINNASGAANCTPTHDLLTHAHHSRLHSHAPPPPPPPPPPPSNGLADNSSSLLHRHHQPSPPPPLPLNLNAMARYTNLAPNLLANQSQHALPQEVYPPWSIHPAARLSF